MIVAALLSLLSWQCFGASPEKNRQTESEYLVKYWSVEEGLPGNSVFAISQSSDGYLWIATDAGLARFDGIRFSTLTNSAGSEIQARNLAASGDGALWITDDKSRLLRYKKAGVETVFPNSDGQLAQVNCMLSNGEEAILIGAENGLFRYAENGGLERVGSLDGLGKTAVKALSDAGNGSLWIGASNGLWHLSDAQLQSLPPIGVEVSAVSARGDGSVLIGGARFGLMQKAAGNDVPRRVWPVSKLSDFIRLSNGDVWMSGGGGKLQRLSLENGAVLDLNLPIASERCFFEDREGSLWVGTDGGGLVQIRRKPIRLFEIKQGETSHAILSLTEGAKGEVWLVGETGGIYRWAKDRIEPPEIKIGSGEPYFEAIQARRSGGIWAGSRFDGLYFWTGGSSLPMNKAASIVGITHLFEDAQERLWIASSRDGLLMMQGGRTREIKAPEWQLFTQVSAVAQDNEGRIWIGTRRNGLAEWKEHSTQWQNAAALKDARIECLYSDLEGTLWIGTNRGLVARKGGQFYGATTQQGLYDNIIYQIVEDFRGNLVLGSNRGIFRVGKDELDDLFTGKVSSIEPILYGVEEGLGTLEAVSGGQAIKTRDGKLCFSTHRGLAVIDTGRQASTVPPGIQLEEIRVGQKRFSPPPSGVFEVRATSEPIELRYAALTFIAPERAQVRIQLEGVSEGWVRSNGSGNATFTRVPVGDHHFRVMARGETSGWSEPVDLLVVRVYPPFWETGWFKAALVALALGIILIFAQAAAAKQRQLDGLRQQITRDLHDDLGSNLGSIALLSEALQRAPKHPGSTPELLGEINNIARQTLESMRDALWFVDPEKDASQDLVAHLRNISDSMLKNTPHVFDSGESERGVPIPLHVKRGVVLIFKESLHNVLRHSGATEVRIQAEVRRGEFVFKVMDNGKGFDAGQEFSGHGLRNIRHRAEKLGAELKVTSEPNSGTSVEFQVKLV